MATCELCGADLPAQVDACPACGRTFRARSTGEPIPPRSAHPSLEFAFETPLGVPPSRSDPGHHPSLEFAFAQTKETKAPARPFDPFDTGVTARPPPPVTRTPSPAGGDFIGRTIAGRFHIEALIGEGGMGQVYRARHEQLGRTVCVKVLRPGLQSDPAVLKRFEREARSASRLHHPNSIQVLDFGVDQGAMYLAMEFVDGCTLRDILRDEFPLPEARICHLVAQVLAALAEAHAAQIVHRDLKPDNIMVSQLREQPDFVKVLDFGIAKILESDDNLTAADMLCGTPQYMSPEQAGGRKYDGRADLYSIGVILYQLITGDVPFNGRNPLEVLSKSQVQAPMPIHEKRPGAQVSPQLTSLVMRALSKDPDGRPQTAEIFRRELLRIGEAAERAQHDSAPAVTPVRPSPVKIPSPVPEPTRQMTMLLSDAVPPPPLAQMLEPMAPSTPAGATHSLPRVGEAVRFELAETPRPRRRSTTPATPSRRPASSGWLKRALVLTALVIAAGVAARWAFAEAEPSAIEWFSGLFEGS